MIDTATGIWKRRKWPLLATFFAVVLVAMAVVVALPSVYRASTLVLVGQSEISESMVTNTRFTDFQQRFDALRQSILSRATLLDLIDQHELYPELRQEVTQSELLERMRDDIIISVENTSGNQNQGYLQTLEVSYQTWDPEVAAEVANDIAALYERESRASRLRQASNTTAFLEEQLNAARTEFQKQERLLNEFKSRNLGSLPEQESVNLATMDRLNDELTLNGEKQIQLLDRRDALLNNSRDLADSGRSNMEGLSAQTRLALMRQDLNALRSRYTDQYPDVVRLKTEISALEQRIRNGEADSERSGAERAAEDDEVAALAQRRYTVEGIEMELQALRDREMELQQQIAEIESRLASSPNIEQDLTRLNRDFATASETYFGFQQRYQDARLAESLQRQQTSQFQVLERAIPPEFSAGPSAGLLTMMILVAAAGLAGALVIGLEQLDTSFHSQNELRAFTRVPILTYIGMIETPADKRKSRARFLGAVLVYLLVVAVLVVLAYNFGTDNRGLVWTLTG